MFDSHSLAMSFAHNARTLLSSWIFTLLAAVPLHSRKTFVELLGGCLVFTEGWVSRAIGSIARGSHWPPPYKLLQRGTLRTKPLAQALLQLLLAVLPQTIVTLIVDDTLVPRCSDSAPGVALRHDHSHKQNRPTFLNAQCWVTLAVSLVGIAGLPVVFPVRSRLVPDTGNRNKLTIALALLRVFLPTIPVPARLLCDSWFVRRKLLLPILKPGVSFIGQARRDTALYRPPAARTPGQRGRTAKYGAKYRPDDLAALPVTEHQLCLYSQPQRLRLRSVTALARFLKALPVRAVWCELYDEKKQRWCNPCLILSSDLSLTPVEIVTLYSRRWGIEPLFHNLKRWWGVTNRWQQSRRVLELWMQIRGVAWSLVQLLAHILGEEFPIHSVSPWRAGRPLTAGLAAAWLRHHFSRLPFRDA